MSVVIDLGKVVGSDATINGHNAVSLTSPQNSGLDIVDDGEGNISLEPDMDILQGKVDGDIGDIVGFNANGNAKAVPLTGGIGIDVEINANSVKVSNRKVELYGFQLNTAESAPASIITYLGDCDNKNYTPAKMNFTSGEFEYGDWSQAWFIKNLKPCILGYNGQVLEELDPNNYAKKKDGTNSSIASTAVAGNVMVGIPTVWVKVDRSTPSKPKFYFASEKLDNTYHAWCHTAVDGSIKDYIYMPAYNGVIVDGKLRSISGLFPANAVDGETQILDARANGNGWDIERYADQLLITQLLLLIGRSTNSQAVFGEGNSNGYNDPASGAGANGVLNTGTMNALGLFWGSNDKKRGVKVFGLENYWGNVYRMVMGLVLSSGTLYYKLTEGNQDGSTPTSFDISELGGADGTSGSANLGGWIPAGTCTGGTSGGSGADAYWYGYIGGLKVDDNGIMIPNNASTGTETTYYCDRLYYRKTAKRMARFGCYSSDGSFCGIFGVYLRSFVSRSYWFCGASPSFH